MKRILILAISMLACLKPSAQEKEIVYTDASIFPTYGKAAENTSGLYERFPAEFEQISRPDLWYLSRHSAGIFIRFRSNSTRIFARWTSTYNTWMNHQTPVGTKGLDLYAILDGEWRFVGCGRPGRDAESTCAILVNSDPVEREYMMYLSLYDGVSSLEIGVDEGAMLEQPVVDRPSRKRPIVMYGTSVLQGGCANRPGMCHTSIIGRILDTEVINLGFSGNAFLDMEVAQLMAGVENPGLYVLDMVPNASVEMMEEKLEAFFNVLRNAHPDVPVIFIEDPIFPIAPVDNRVKREVARKNSKIREIYGRIRKSGAKKTYYIGAEGMLGDDGEATVDGYHPTDLGMMRYVEHVMPTIKKALRKQ